VTVKCVVNSSYARVILTATLKGFLLTDWFTAVDQYSATVIVKMPKNQSNQ